jgi:Mn-dependent DtxR family transcriptional regulator
LTDDRRRVESELRGRSLEVFMYVVKAGRPVGVRDVQRGLSLSSPSVAHHHLEKLHGLGLLQKDERGSYTAAEKLDVSVLQAFVRGWRKVLTENVFLRRLLHMLHRTLRCHTPRPTRHIRFNAWFGGVGGNNL